MIRRSHPLNHAQCGLIPFDLAQQFISVKTSGKLPGLLARCPDLFAQAIGLRCFAHCRSAPVGQIYAMYEAQAGRFPEAENISGSVGAAYQRLPMVKQGVCSS
jgi:hypothetical protein